MKSIYRKRKNFLFPNSFLHKAVAETGEGSQVKRENACFLQWSNQHVAKPWAQWCLFSIHHNLISALVWQILSERTKGQITQVFISRCFSCYHYLITHSFTEALRAGANHPPSSELFKTLSCIFISKCKEQYHESERTVSCAEFIATWASMHAKRSTTQKLER